MDAAAKSISARVADYAVSFDLESTPPQVLENAKILFLDLIGAALAGVETEEGRAVFKTAKALGVGGEASVWRNGLTTNPAHAALANGVIAHAQELDDFGGCDHSGAVVIPAILAIAESEGITDGRCVLEAMILGYEFGVRALDVFGGYRACNNLGWHSTATCGSIGAAVASAKMLQLDQDRTRDAIGHAANVAGGTWAFLADGAMAKRVNAGKAAENGVMSAYLAANGMTGPGYVFEADWGGILNTWSHEEVFPEKLFDGLGLDFGLMRSGIKPHASCRGAHSATDSALRLRQHIDDHSEIAAVRIRCNQYNLRTLGDRAPETRLAAQMSMPYAVAAAFVYGHSDLEVFEEPAFSDPPLREFLKRVEI
jgi:2-methylcitrate dehydratase PrpD